MGSHPETFKFELPSMERWEDSIGYNPEQMFSTLIDNKPFYRYQRHDKTMITIHISRIDNKNYRLNLMDDKTIRDKMEVLKRGQA